MKKINFGIILSLALVFSLSSCRQLSTSSKVLINEVMMDNQTSATDEYGDHPAWIELFVKYYGPIDVAGYVIEVEPKGEPAVSYHIPKGDVITKVQPRQHIVFWADGQPNRGTLHTNFTLNPEKFTTIRLYNSNLDKIDEVEIMGGSLKADQAYGRKDATYTELGAENWEVKDSSDGNPDTYVTPGSANRVIDLNAKQENFARQDPSGIGMALTAMTVVFSCLLLLFFAFKFVGKTSVRMAQRNAIAAKGGNPDIADMKTAMAKENQTPGEVFAAIAMALHEEMEDVHDTEETVITLNMEDHQLSSPWSSKTLLMRHTPIRKR